MSAPDGWAATVVRRARAGGDIADLLRQQPDPPALASAGRALVAQARYAPTGTAAASQFGIAALLLARAGHAAEAAAANEAAFAAVHAAVAAGGPEPAPADAGPWRYERVAVRAPVRADLAGGWSDTPPYSLDWGGAVVNVAIRVGGHDPVRVEVRRLRDPVIRLYADGRERVLRGAEDLAEPTGPGSPFLIAGTALRQMGWGHPEGNLADALRRRGGGLEIRSRVDLPLGSGLGVSSVLAAATLAALHRMVGHHLSTVDLSSAVLRLEQAMGTGGGWQDQAGALYPGAKLLTSQPGAAQRLRVEPLPFPATLRERIVLYHTGVDRVARDLLREVVRRYLVRDRVVVQALHHTRALGHEMAQAIRTADPRRVGRLLDRQWNLNRRLDPHTSDLRLDGLLAGLRPALLGAKLAGAGGGGFLILLAMSPAAAEALRSELSRRGGTVHDWAPATDGLRIDCGDAVSPAAAGS